MRKRALSTVTRLAPQQVGLASVDVAILWKKKRRKNYE